MGKLQHFIRDEAGAIALVFGIAAPLIIGGAALAVDAAVLNSGAGRLQAVADSAALAGAKELHLYRTDYAPLEEGVRQRTLALLAEDSLSATAASPEVVVDGEAGTVTVSLRAAPQTMLLDALGYPAEVAAAAQARIFGSTRLCVLALDPMESGAIRAARIATIDAAECAVQSNSAAPDGLDVELLSHVGAVSICSAGGAAGPDAAFSPAPETDCPALDDPLADKVLPDPGPCDHRNVTILLPRTIHPGHYCGGLNLLPTALVTAAPGDYVISGGPLNLAAGSSLVGDGVSFRFLDADSTFSFGLGSIVSLGAPSEGPMAGYLFFQDPGIPRGQTFLIATDLATRLLGTIYLPSATLLVDVIGLVAAQSAYTVVVVDRLDIRGADLVINSDYGITDVPVPAGVGPTAGQVVLER